MDTSQAFEYLINNNKLLSSLSVNSNTIKSWKKRFNHNEMTTDKMEEVLNLAGFEKKPETWKKPRKKIQLT